MKHIYKIQKGQAATLWCGRDEYLGHLRYGELCGVDTMLAHPDEKYCQDCVQNIFQVVRKVVCSL